MDRKIIAAAAILGFVAIILGAFGAHALKKVLDVEQLVSFETGVRYQMYHALFLLFLGTTKLVSDKTKSTIYYLVISGVLFFSGSIYLLATRNITNIDFSVIGFITPIGGLLMIIAWALLFLNILKQKA
ncbi:DUF423 domain-containing protein [uncultured Flavobacterium sp.]|uniref:DUF423 domain-containing protein n=1 Tax=uncultured Flavobacterium sp. TaxID=165435 RepID=UPI0011F60617|nr:DUF423 domain-containing protein [uncultured Flavobacterium sp.]THD33188.1 MAG: DUF423 domain-containing protein [Flavobacterium johnsoniae]